MKALLLAAWTLSAAPPLPSADAEAKAVAEHALTSARSAVEQAAASNHAKGDALKRLARAEELFRAADYARAAQEADQAWKLVTRDGPQPSRFAVEVEKDGRTRVRVRGGDPVRVEAQGKVQTVAEGQRVEVVKGERPGRPVADVGAVLNAPELIKPAPGAKLTLAEEPDRKNAVLLAWGVVEGAEGYVVEVVPGAGGRGVVLKLKRTEVALPGLAQGSYRWHVRAVGPGGEEASSPERTFELVANPLKLEVHESNWK